MTGSIQQIIAGAAVALMLSFHASGGLADSTTASVTASQGSVAAFELSLVGSLKAADASVHASAQLVRASLHAVEASARLGTELALVSIVYTGTVARLVYRTSAAVAMEASKASGKAIEFSVELSRAAVEASLAASEPLLTAIGKGTAVAVKAVAITAGTAGQVIGYSLVAAASPAVVLSVVLNEVGRQLYAVPAP